MIVKVRDVTKADLDLEWKEVRAAEADESDSQKARGRRFYSWMWLEILEHEYAQQERMGKK